MSDPRESAGEAAPESLQGLLSELSALLHSEYAALAARDVDALEALVARKRAVVEALEVAAAGARDGRQPLPDATALRTLVEDCVVANRTNGGVIALNRELVGSVLDTLYGVSRSARTYGAAGRIDGPDAVRSVARA